MTGFIETLLCLIFIIPVVLFIITVYFLALMGISLGFRRRSVQLLLYIFEYGRKRIETAHRKKYGYYDEDETEEPESVHDPNGNKDAKTPTHVDQTVQTVNVNGINSQNNSRTDITDTKLSPGETDKEEVKNGMITKEKPDFIFSDVFEFVQGGIEAIVEDQVTKRFVAEELKSWNLLTRTNRRYEFISWRLTMIWVVGFFVRYCVMMPLRVMICFLGTITLTTLTFLVGIIPDGLWDGKVKKELNQRVSKFCFRLLSRAFSAIVTYHSLENKPNGSGICVANHTSPIDVVLLACDSCFALIGQRHGGFLGILQRALARASSHIWFERSEMKDREAVARRLKEHVDDPNKLPILIFPEGTCINNSAVMQFKKGSFEVGGDIYPVAIKYDARFGDPFWDSSRYSMLQYLFNMMTSWAIVCDVWYLPKMRCREGESAVDFANRVKSEIARRGGLVDLDWDGQLKRSQPKGDKMKRRQFEYSKKFSSNALSAMDVDETSVVPPANVSSDSQEEPEKHKSE